MMRTILLWLIRAYRFFISPLLGQNCRFYPSCSEYAVQAVQQHGAAKGSWLAARRLCRCHPWHPGGVDLVPPCPTHTDLKPMPAATTSGAGSTSSSTLS